MSEETRHNIDFGLQKNLDNPFQKKERGHHKRRKTLVIILGIVCFLVTFFTILYHSFFRITTINISGLQRIKQMELSTAVQGMMDYKILFFLPANNYFFANVDEIRSLVLSRFPVETVSVKKVFPNYLEINLEEKISTIIYDNGKQYCYLGSEGHAVEILRNVGDDEWRETKNITTTTLADGTIRIIEEIVDRKHTPAVSSIIATAGDYPLIYDERGLEVKINSQVLKPEMVNGIFLWFNLLKKKSDIPLTHFIIKDESGSVVIKTKEGWEVRANLFNRIEEQFGELKYLITEKVKRTELSYVDIRFDDRVYWQ